MKISDMLQLVEARLAMLNGAHTTAMRQGDAARLAQLEAEIAEVAAMLTALRSLSE